jgi:hypothetical protein
MARSRSVLTVLVGVAAMLLALAWIPSSAHAAGNITVTGVSNSPDPYVLQVTVDDANGLKLTGMTVHLFSGTTDVYDVTDMQYTNGSTDNVLQTWTAAAPIPSADLPLGTYTVTVDAADSSESDSALTAPSPVSVLYTPTVTVGASPNVLSYGDTSTTLSGLVTGSVVGGPSGTPVPLGGLPVMLFDANAGTETQFATTQSDGTYSGQADLTNLLDQYSVVVDSGPTMNSGGSGPLPITINSVATRFVSAQVTPTDFVYGSGQPATLSGTLQYDNANTGWQPLPSSNVVAVAGQDIKYLTTDAQGQFTWSYSPDSDGTSWNIEAGGGNLFGVSQQSGTIHVAVPVKFTSFTASLNAFAQLGVKACVQVTAPGFNMPGSRLTIQYSTKPTGPWSSLGTIAMNTSGINVPSSCSGGADGYFHRTLNVKLANAYYRASLPATVNNQAVASTPLHRWRYVTRISVSVSSTVVHRGGKLTISGRLQQWNGKWRNFAGQKIIIIAKPRGSKRWLRLRGTVRTSSTGHYSRTFVDPVTAYWSAIYAGNATHFASGGSVHHVTLESVVAAAGLTGATALHAMTPGTNPLTDARVITALARGLT